MKPPLVASTLEESGYPAWNELVGAAPAGSIYARPEYLDALCTAAGGSFRILAAHQGEQLLGGIGLYERRDRLGRYAWPRLLLYYQGPVLRPSGSKYPSEQTASALKVLAALELGLRELRYDSVLLKARSPLLDVRPFLAQGWKATPGYTYVVPIADLAQARARIEQNLRRLIDRCEREGMVFSEDDDFDSFFALHAHTMDRIGWHVYLEAAEFRGFYQTLARQGLARLFFARLPDGQPAAAQLVLLGHAVTHTVAAGADPAHLRSGATAFLRWKGFERLSQLGHTANDLTDATLNSVTHFKSQLGGVLEPWLMVRSRESVRFRLGRRATDLAGQARGAAGAVARRLLRRRAADKYEATGE